jgi:hypothetical protein
LVAIDVATARFLFCEVIGDAYSLLPSVQSALEFVRRLGVRHAACYASAGSWAAASCRRVEVRVLRADLDE